MTNGEEYFSDDFEGEKAKRRNRRKRKEKDKPGLPEEEMERRARKRKEKKKSQESREEKIEHLTSLQKKLAGFLSVNKEKINTDNAVRSEAGRLIEEIINADAFTYTGESALDTIFDNFQELQQILQQTQSFEEKDISSKEETQHEKKLKKAKFLKEEAGPAIEEYKKIDDDEIQFNIDALEAKISDLGKVIEYDDRMDTIIDEILVDFERIQLMVREYHELETAKNELADMRKELLSDIVTAREDADELLRTLEIGEEIEGKQYGRKPSTHQKALLGFSKLSDEVTSLYQELTNLCAHADSLLAIETERNQERAKAKRTFEGFWNYAATLITDIGLSPRVLQKFHQEAISELRKVGVVEPYKNADRYDQYLNSRLEEIIESQESKVYRIASEKYDQFSTLVEQKSREASGLDSKKIENEAIKAYGGVTDKKDSLVAFIETLKNQAAQHNIELPDNFSELKLREESYREAGQDPIIMEGLQEVISEFNETVKKLRKDSKIPENDEPIIEKLIRGVEVMCTRDKDPRTLQEGVETLKKFLKSQYGEEVVLEVPISVYTHKEEIIEPGRFQRATRVVEDFYEKVKDLQERGIILQNKEENRRMAETVEWIRGRMVTRGVDTPERGATILKEVIKSRFDVDIELEVPPAPREKEQMRIYDDPEHDPAIQDVIQNIAIEVDNVPGKEEPEQVTRERIARDYWVQFINLNPEKAKGYIEKGFTPLVEAKKYQESTKVEMIPPDKEPVTKWPEGEKKKVYTEEETLNGRDSILREYQQRSHELVEDEAGVPQIPIHTFGGTGDVMNFEQDNVSLEEEVWDEFIEEYPEKAAAYRDRMQSIADAMNRKERRDREVADAFAQQELVSTSGEHREKTAAEKKSLPQHHKVLLDQFQICLDNPENKEKSEMLKKKYDYWMQRAEEVLRQDGAEGLRDFIERGLLYRKNNQGVFSDSFLSEVRKQAQAEREEVEKGEKPETAVVLHEDRESLYKKRTEDAYRKAFQLLSAKKLSQAEYQSIEKRLDECYKAIEDPEHASVSQEFAYNLINKIEVQLDDVSKRETSGDDELFEISEHVIEIQSERLRQEYLTRAQEFLRNIETLAQQGLLEQWQIDLYQVGFENQINYLEHPEQFATSLETVCQRLDSLSAGWRKIEAEATSREASEQGTKKFPEKELNLDEVVMIYDAQLIIARIQALLSELVKQGMEKNIADAYIVLCDRAFKGILERQSKEDYIKLEDIEAALRSNNPEVCSKVMKAYNEQSTEFYDGVGSDVGYNRILQEECLNYLREHDKEWFSTYFSGEVSEKGYLLDRNGNETEPAPAMCVGVGWPIVQEKALRRYEEEKKNQEMDEFYGKVFEAGYQALTDGYEINGKHKKLSQERFNKIKSDIISLLSEGKLEDARDYISKIFSIADFQIIFGHIVEQPAEQQEDKEQEELQEIRNNNQDAIESYQILVNQLEAKGVSENIINEYRFELGQCEEANEVDPKRATLKLDYITKSLQTDYPKYYKNFVETGGIDSLAVTTDDEARYKQETLESFRFLYRKITERIDELPDSDTRSELMTLQDQIHEYYADIDDGRGNGPEMIETIQGKLYTIDRELYEKIILESPPQQEIVHDFISLLEEKISDRLEQVDDEDIRLRLREIQVDLNACQTELSNNPVLVVRRLNKIEDQIKDYDTRLYDDIQKSWKRDEQTEKETDQEQKQEQEVNIEDEDTIKEQAQKIADNLHHLVDYLDEWHYYDDEKRLSAEHHHTSINNTIDLVDQDPKNNFEQIVLLEKTLTHEHKDDYEQIIGQQERNKQAFLDFKEHIQAAIDRGAIDQNTGDSFTEKAYTLFTEGNTEDLQELIHNAVLLIHNHERIKEQREEAEQIVKDLHEKVDKLNESGFYRKHKKRHDAQWHHNQIEELVKNDEHDTNTLVELKKLEAQINVDFRFAFKNVAEEKKTGSDALESFKQSVEKAVKDGVLDRATADRWNTFAEDTVRRAKETSDEDEDRKDPVKQLERLKQTLVSFKDQYRDIFTDPVGNETEQRMREAALNDFCERLDHAVEDGVMDGRYAGRVKKQAEAALQKPDGMEDFEDLLERHARHPAYEKYFEEPTETPPEPPSPEPAQPEQRPERSKEFLLCNIDINPSEIERIISEQFTTLIRDVKERILTDSSVDGMRIREILPPEHLTQCIEVAVTRYVDSLDLGLNSEQQEQLTQIVRELASESAEKVLEHFESMIDYQAKENIGFFKTLREKMTKRSKVTMATTITATLGLRLLTFFIPGAGTLRRTAGTATAAGTGGVVGLVRTAVRRSVNRSFKKRAEAQGKSLEELEEIELAQNKEKSKAIQNEKKRLLTHRREKRIVDGKNKYINEESMADVIAVTVRNTSNEIFRREPVIDEHGRINGEVAEILKTNINNFVEHDRRYELLSAEEKGLTKKQLYAQLVLELRAEAVVSSETSTGMDSKTAKAVKRFQEILGGRMPGLDSKESMKAVAGDTMLGTVVGALTRIGYLDDRSRAALLGVAGAGLGGVLSMRSKEKKITKTYYEQCQALVTELQHRVEVIAYERNRASGRDNERLTGLESELQEKLLQLRAQVSLKRDNGRYFIEDPVLRLQAEQMLHTQLKEQIEDQVTSETSEQALKASIDRMNDNVTLEQTKAAQALARKMDETKVSKGKVTAYTLMGAAAGACLGFFSDELMGESREYLQEKLGLGSVPGAEKGVVIESLNGFPASIDSYEDYGRIRNTFVSGPNSNVQSRAMFMLGEFRGNSQYAEFIDKHLSEKYNISEKLSATQIQQIKSDRSLLAGEADDYLKQKAEEGACKYDSNTGKYVPIEDTASIQNEQASIEQVDITNKKESLFDSVKGTILANDKISMLGRDDWEVAHAAGDTKLSYESWVEKHVTEMVAQLVDKNGNIPDNFKNADMLWIDTSGDSPRLVRENPNSKLSDLEPIFVPEEFKEKFPKIETVADLPDTLAEQFNIAPPSEEDLREIANKNPKDLAIEDVAKIAMAEEHSDVLDPKLRAKLDNQLLAKINEYPFLTRHFEDVRASCENALLSRMAGEKNIMGSVILADKAGLFERSEFTNRLKGVIGEHINDGNALDNKDMQENILVLARCEGLRSGIGEPELFIRFLTNGKEHLSVGSLGFFVNNDGQFDMNKFTELVEEFKETAHDPDSVLSAKSDHWMPIHLDSKGGYAAIGLVRWNGEAESYEYMLGDGQVKRISEGEMLAWSHGFSGIEDNLADHLKPSEEFIDGFANKEGEDIKIHYDAGAKEALANEGFEFQTRNIDGEEVKVLHGPGGDIPFHNTRDIHRISFQKLGDGSVVMFSDRNHMVVELVKSDSELPENQWSIRETRGLEGENVGKVGEVRFIFDEQYSPEERRVIQENLAQVIQSKSYNPLDIATIVEQVKYGLINPDQIEDVLKGFQGDLPKPEQEMFDLAMASSVDGVEIKPDDIMIDQTEHGKNIIFRKFISSDGTPKYVEVNYGDSIAPQNRILNQDEFRNRLRSRHWMVLNENDIKNNKRFS